MLACFLCPALLFTLAPQVPAQQVSPALLEAARQAYQQGQQSQPEILVPAQVQSQVAPASEADWNNLRQLLVGERIAVKTKDNITHYGEFLAYSDEAISLRKGKREVNFRRAEVLRVSRPGPAKRWLGALIGGAIGFAIGAPVGARKFTESGEKKNGIIIFGGTIGALCAYAGAALAPRSQTVIYRVGP